MFISFAHSLIVKNYLLTVPAIQFLIFILKQNKVLILRFNFALKFFNISWLLIFYFNAKMVRFFDSLQANTNKEKNVKLKLFFSLYIWETYSIQSNCFEIENVFGQGVVPFTVENWTQTLLVFKKDVFWLSCNIDYIAILHTMHHTCF